MSEPKTAVVECIRDGRVIATYSLGIPKTAGPSSPPSKAEIEKEAKLSLSNEGLASPPFEGITFKVREE
jgi:hypothetical protein